MVSFNFKSSYVGKSWTRFKEKDSGRLKHTVLEDWSGELVVACSAYVSSTEPFVLVGRVQEATIKHAQTCKWKNQEPGQETEWWRPWARWQPRVSGNHGLPTWWATRTLVRKRMLYSWYLNIFLNNELYRIIQHNLTSRQTTFQSFHQLISSWLCHSGPRMCLSMSHLIH